MRIMKLARRYYLKGVVQGVGFRYFTYRIAQQHHITGYVRNLDDGRVEVLAEGEEADLAPFVAELCRGPRLAVVEDVQVEERTPTDAKEFRIA